MNIRSIRRVLEIVEHYYCTLSESKRITSNHIVGKYFGDPTTNHHVRTVCPLHFTVEVCEVKTHIQVQFVHK